jgi:hypothetical protein
VLGKLISLEGAQTWASTAQPVTNDTTTYFSLPFTAENPSDCLSALVEYAVEFEISVNMDDDARFRGFFNGNRYQDFTQRGGSASNIGWQLTSTQAFILGPGASSAQTVNIGVDKIGSADVYLQRIEVRIRGLITAMEM